MWAKRVITNNANATVEKPDFRLYSLAEFTDFKTLAVSSQYFNCMPLEDFNFSIFLSSQNGKPMLKRASSANKSFFLFSMKSCDNCFCFFYATQEYIAKFFN